MTVLLCPTCDARLAGLPVRAPCAKCGWKASSKYIDYLSSSYRVPSFDWKGKADYAAICSGGGAPEPWGACCMSLLHEDQVTIVQKHLPSHVLYIADVSAGCGLQLAELAKHARHSIHWEAHVPSLEFASQHYCAKGVANVTLCRGSYLDFRVVAESLDVVLAFDTFERGTEHDRFLLANVGAALTFTGRAFVDFHSRGRESPSVRPYTEEEFRHIAETVGLEVLGFESAGFAPTVRKLNWVITRIATYYAMLRGKPARKVAILRLAGGRHRSSNLSNR